MNVSGLNKILQILGYTLPLCIIGSMILLAKSPIFEDNAGQLAPAIIIDLILTLPLVYFFIIRKKAIPKTTVVPVLIIGVVVASLIIPEQHQGILDIFKTWVLPLVELSVVTYVIITIRKSVKAFKKQDTGQFDFFTNLKMALRDILPAKVIPFAALEFGAFYYGFIKWKKHTVADNEFTYHRESGTIAILLVLVFLILIETFALHLLLINWSPILAWVLTGLSIYSGFQIIGILKSLIHRQIQISDSHLILKYGIIADATVALENIDRIFENKTELDENSTAVSFSPLGSLEGHNVRIVLKSPITISGAYGTRKTAQEIAIFVDKPLAFVKAIANKLI